MGSHLRLPARQITRCSAAVRRETRPIICDRDEFTVDIIHQKAILQMSTLLVLHVVISLVGIAAGFVVAYGLLTSQRLSVWTATFLTTTIATSLSGFLLPADRFLPSHALAILSLIALALAVYALYGKRLSGSWNNVYVVTALVSQYFNVFVLVVQSFQKVPALRALAPTQMEPIFAITHLLVLAAFVTLGIFSIPNRLRTAATRLLAAHGN